MLLGALGARGDSFFFADYLTLPMSRHNDSLRKHDKKFPTAALRPPRESGLLTFSN